MTRHASEPERRRQILRAARAVFVDRGFRAARMDDVAREAGLSKGALYFYFKSKDALFEEVASQEHRRTGHLLDGIRQAEGSAPEKLERIVRAFLDHFMGLESPPRFFLIMADQASRTPALYEQFDGIHARFVSQLAEVLEQGVSEGVFRPVPPEHVALMLKALSDGLACQTAIGLPLTDPRLADSAVSVLMNGLRPELAHA